MVTKKLFVVLIAAFLTCSQAYAKEISGVSMPDTFMAGQTNLILNGAGIRTKFFMKMYVGGLYLLQKSNDALKVIGTDEAMAIRLHIVSSMITSERMEAATREGFENATNNNIAPIKAQIEKFVAVFKDKIQENDTYDFVNVMGKGVEIYKNGKLNTLIEGVPFKQALFGIWLCDKPAQKSLKEEMLGN